MSRWRSNARSICGIVVCVTIVGLSVVTVRASAMDDFCSFWNGTTQPPDTFGCLSGGAPYTWNGDYDFSSWGDDALMHAADMCNDLFGSCADTCGSTGYREWALDQVNQEAWPNCEYDISCIESWDNASCDMGTSGSFSCSCTYWNVCAPC